MQCSSPSANLDRPHVFTPFYMEAPQSSLAQLPEKALKALVAYLVDARDKQSLARTNKTFYRLVLESEKERLKFLLQQALIWLYGGIPDNSRSLKYRFSKAINRCTSLNGLYQSFCEGQARLGREQPTCMLLAQRMKPPTPQAILSSRLLSIPTYLFWYTSYQQAQVKEGTYISPDYLLSLLRGNCLTTLHYLVKHHPDNTFLETLSQLPDHLPQAIFPNSHPHIFHHHEAMLWVRHLRIFATVTHTTDPIIQKCLLFLDTHIDLRIRRLLSKSTLVPRKDAIEELRAAIAWEQLLSWSPEKKSLQTEIAYHLLRQGFLPLLWHFLDYQLDGDPRCQNELISQCLVILALQSPIPQMQAVIYNFTKRLAPSSIKVQTESFLACLFSPRSNIALVGYADEISSIYLPILRILHDSEDGLKGTFILLLALLKAPKPHTKVHLSCITDLLQRVRTFLYMFSVQERYCLYQALCELFNEATYPDTTPLIWTIYAQQLLQPNHFDIEFWRIILDALQLASLQDSQALTPPQMDRLQTFCLSLIGHLDREVDNEIWQRFFQQLSMLVPDPCQHQSLRTQLLLQLPKFAFLPQCCWSIPDEFLFPLLHIHQTTVKNTQTSMKRGSR